MFLWLPFVCRKDLCRGSQADMQIERLVFATHHPCHLLKLLSGSCILANKDHSFTQVETCKASVSCYTLFLCMYFFIAASLHQWLQDGLRLLMLWNSSPWGLWGLVRHSLQFATLPLQRMMMKLSRKSPKSTKPLMGRCWCTRICQSPWIQGLSSSLGKMWMVTFWM